MRPAIQFDPSSVPFSQEAEEATIGAVLINPGIFPTLAAFLKAEDFMLLRHQSIWQTFARLTGLGADLDLLLVKEDLEAHGKLDEVGGISYLTQVANNTPSATRAVAYAQLVQRASIRRGMLLLADEVKRLALDEEMPVAEVIAITHELLEIQDKSLTKIGTTHISELAIRHIEIMKQRITMFRENPNYVVGVSSGLTDLDRATDGLMKGAIITVAAATGVGKTAFVTSLALHASKAGIKRKTTRPAKVVMFSGEMSDEQLTDRLIGMKSGVDNRKIQRGAIDEPEWRKISTAIHELSEHELELVSIKSMTPYEIKSLVHERVRNGNLDMLILDGLMQLDAFSVPKGLESQYQKFEDGKRRDALEMVMNSLERIALTYNIPIILTHQISRAAGNRTDKRPRLSDLAEASFVEQKSMVVILLYRDEYYNPGSTDAPNEMEIHIAKNRFGTSNTVTAYYDAERTMVVNGKFLPHSIDAQDLSDL